MMMKKDKVCGKQFLWHIATEMNLWREGGGGRGLGEEMGENAVFNCMLTNYKIELKSIIFQKI